LDYEAQVARRLGAWADVVDLGLVDDAPGAFLAGERLARESVDLIFVHTATYATSSQVLPALRGVGAHVVVLNLQPSAALDYERTDTGEWLANCSACCVPELSGALARAGLPFHVVSGTLEGPHSEGAWERIRQWCAAAGVRRAVHGARLGFLGHTYPGMLDLYSDFTRISAQLGVHVEVLEMDDLAAHVDAATNAEVDAIVATTRATFAVQEGVDTVALRWAARVAAGMDRLVREADLSGLAYYHRGRDRFAEIGASLILGGSLLTARGVPCSGEGDLKNCVAMLMMDRLSVGGSYTEIYAMDFAEGFILMGHDGPGHLAICDAKPVLRSLGLFHGKVGAGVSVEFRIKLGPVTILGVTDAADGRLKLLTAEGDSLPGPLMRIGNTNSRIRFPLAPADFMDRWCAYGPTHHVALGTGRVAATLERLATLLGLGYASVAVAG
jgi:L-arabinose isomerase